ncbi:MAG: glycosyltransferase family 4 protein [Microcoleus sp. CAN_BIN18]|nr:glycosyltransferase family 4 protein [Microcoleus sp. CAN_BIN18]
MKLCIVTPSVIKGDGQGRANYEIVWESLRRGHDVTLLSRRIDPELQQHPKVKWVFFAVEGLPLQLLREISFAWQSAAWLQQHRHEFDVLQVYGAVTPFPADVNTSQFVHSAWLRSPYHISRQRRDLYGAYQWLYSVLNARWEKQAFRQAKFAIAVSDKICEELVEIGVPRDRIHVILNGVDLQEFSPGSASRQAFNLPENVTLGLFVGDIRLNRKNLDTVLYAAAKVPDLHLVVVGDTTRSPYPKMAAQLGIQDRVHFLGFRQDVPDLMKAADFLVFPSRYEPFGLVVLEAMATGIPVITAATTGAAELVTPDCGFVLPDSEDTQALAEALNQLVKCDRQQRQQMGQVARAIAEQHSWANMAGNYVNLFEELQPC